MAANGVSLPTKNPSLKNTARASMSRSVGALFDKADERRGDAHPIIRKVGPEQRAEAMTIIADHEPCSVPVPACKNAVGDRVIGGYLMAELRTRLASRFEPFTTFSCKEIRMLGHTGAVPTKASDSVSA